MKPKTIYTRIKGLALKASTLAIIFLVVFWNGYAEGAPKLRKDAYRNQYGAELPNLSSFTIQEEWAHRRVKQLRIGFDISFPTNTGDDVMDQHFKTEAENNYREIVTDWGSDSNADLCEELGFTGCGASYIKVFLAQAPSPDILSIIYFENLGYMGAASGLYEMTTHTYNLKEHRELSFSDIFTDYPKTIPLLWTRIVRGWCDHPENTYKDVPSFYEIPNTFNTCSRKASVPIPAGLRSTPYTFDAPGHAVLTPEGITLTLIDWQSWGSLRQHNEIHIGKDELIKMGARPEIWDPLEEANAISDIIPDSFFFESGITNVSQDYIFEGQVPVAISYIFTLDLLKIINQEFGTISNIVVNTNHGDIQFKSTITKPNVPRFTIGSLRTSKLIGELIITKVTGVIDGRQVDLTQGVYAINDKPLQIHKIGYPTSSTTATCTYKLLDIDTQEGIFMEQLLGENRQIKIKISGKDFNYFFDSHLSYFTNDKANYGKKIKFYTKKYRDMANVNGTATCALSETISDILPID
jgi:hypothetical protein